MTCKILLLGIYKSSAKDRETVKNYKQLQLYPYYFLLVAHGTKGRQPIKQNKHRGLALKDKKSFLFLWISFENLFPGYKLYKFHVIDMDAILNKDIIDPMHVRK